MSLFVEIFHDADGPLQPVEGVHEGIAKVEEVVGQSFIYTRENRRLRIARPDAEEVLSRKIRLKQELPASISVVLTGRKLKDNVDDIVSDTDRAILGEHFFAADSLRNVRATSFCEAGVTVISTHPQYEASSTPRTVTHEMGHLFQILEHCSNDACVMYPAYSGEDDRVYAQAERLIKSLGLTGLGLETPFMPKPAEFCTDCKGELVEQYPSVLARAGAKTLRNLNNL